MIDASARTTRLARIRLWSALSLGATVAALGVSLLRVAQLQIAPPEELSSLDGRRVSEREMRRARGMIVDRGGRPLALSTTGFRIYVDPVFVVEHGWARMAERRRRAELRASGLDDDAIRRLPGRVREPGPIARPDDELAALVGPAAMIAMHDRLWKLADTADHLANDLNLPKAELRAKLLGAPANARFVVLEQKAADWQVGALAASPILGVGLESRLERVYVNEEAAGSIVGTTGFEETGSAGVEYLLQSRLEPEHGLLRVRRDGRGRPIGTSAGDWNPGADGEDIRLTIDLVIQDYARARLERAVEEFDARGGRLVVLDPHSGELLALVDVLRDDERDGFVEVIHDEQRRVHPSLGRNRCVSDPYEPGSTFKPFVWALATELGVDARMPRVEGGRLDVNVKPLRFGRRLIRDAGDRYHGPIADWDTILVHSLNTGMALASQRMLPEDMRRMIDAYGFGERTACGLPGETGGIVTGKTNKLRWSMNYTQISVATGHEIAVTPVQMARAFSAFCSDGTLPQIRLVSEDIDGDAPVFRRRAIPADLALRVRGIMGRVVTEGTGRRARSERYALFGKSGTADLPRPKDLGGGYYKDRHTSNFIAGAPLDNPRLVVLCVIDDPNKKRGHYGGVVAAPTVRDVMDFSLSYLGVPPDLEGAPLGPLVLDPPGLEPLIDPEALADTSAPVLAIGVGE